MAAGGLTLGKGVAPATPSSGFETIFANTEGRIQAIDATGVLRTLSDAARYNYLANGGMWFAQRQAPATLTNVGSTTTRGLSADRWGVTNENANTQFRRVDTNTAPESGLQGRFWGEWTKTTSNGKLVLTQTLEGSNTGILRGRTVRFQFWAKSIVAASATWRVGLVQLNSAGTIDTMPATYISAFGITGVDPTLGTNLAYIAPKSGVTPDNGIVNGSAADITVTTTWQRYGVVFDVPSNCKNIAVSIWSNAQVTTTNGIGVSQTSLSDGYELQDFSPQGIEEELSRCQRYYSKTFNIDTAPAASAGALTGEIRIPAPVTASTAFPAAWTWEFPTQMRAAPTLTLFNPAAAGAQVRNQTLNTDCTLSTVAANGEKRALIAATTPASTVVGTNILGVHVTAEAEL